MEEAGQRESEERQSENFVSNLTRNESLLVANAVL
jgi:hypothetical protein